MKLIDSTLIAQVRESVHLYFANVQTELLPESLIKRCLLNCDMDIDEASEIICQLIKAKLEHPHLFVTSYAEKLGHELLTKNCSILKSKGPNGETIFVIKVKNWDPSEHPYDFVLAAQLFVINCLAMDLDIVKNGLIFAFDTQDMSLKHLRATKPFLLKAFWRIILTAIPVDVKFICSFNVNYISQLLFRATRPLLPKCVNEKVAIAAHVDQLIDVLGEGNKQSILQPSKLDIDCFISKINSNGDTVLDEWRAIDRMLQ